MAKKFQIVRSEEKPDLRLKFLLQCSIRDLAVPWVPLAFCSG